MMTDKTEHCTYCNGSGWVVRDPDIGTDQECFVCSGSGMIEAEVMAEAQEPAYAYRRKGLEYFCTCDEARYNELAQKPNLFEVTTFYTAPQPPAPCQGVTDTEYYRAEFEKLQAKVAILDGLSQDAINGGWTYRGMDAYAKGLEAKVAEQAALINKLERCIECYIVQFEAECKALDEKAALIEEQCQVVQNFQQDQTRMDALIEKCGASIELFLERVEAPDASCSCCISQPCNDCVEYGGLREALQDGKEALAAIASHKKGGSE